MQSQLTVRLPDDLARDVTALAKRLRLKRSDVVRMALQKMIRELPGEEESSPYERVRDLVGKVSSGIPDLGTAHREHLLRKFKNYA